MKGQGVHSVYTRIVAFVTGFVLMAFEMAASRILAPAIGSSTYVWTSVIGVIIAALSLGYWAGGWLADQRKRVVDVAYLLLIAGGAVAITTALYPGFLTWLGDLSLDDRLRGILASFVLFAPSSFVLGMISPYLAKLSVTALSSTGSKIASLSALNSLGGISGTFVTGFWLFAVLGTRGIFMALSLVLVVLSLTFAVRWRMPARVTLGVLFALIVCVPLPPSSTFAIDTPTAHYTVKTNQLNDGAQLRTIGIGPRGEQSGVILGKPDQLVFWYTRELARQVDLLPQKSRILILGGGAYTLPQYLADKYPESNIDVVEIDPQLAQIARQYFDYTPQPSITEIAQDARIYLSQTTARYDIVIVDVYGDINVPVTLMTREYGTLVGRVTKPTGTVLANVVAGQTGACRELLAVSSATYQDEFPYRYTKVDESAATNDDANVILLMARSPRTVPGYTKNTDSRPVFEDDFAPLEPIQQACTNQAQAAAR
jgi:predicted membrane-bound spermidine synthase